MAKIRTIEQLRTELAAKQRQLDRLRSQRAALVRQLEQLDRRIAVLAGEQRPGRKGRKGQKGRKKARRTAPPKPAPTRRTKGRAKPLRAYIEQVLADSPDPMHVKDIAAAVRKAGYPTRSKGFYGLVAAAVREGDGFQNIARGVYRLKA